MRGGADGLRCAILIESSGVAMAKGQMRSNKEKKKPKQDKNKKKGAEASSPYASQYGKKH